MGFSCTHERNIGARGRRTALPATRFFTAEPSDLAKQDSGQLGEISGRSSSAAMIVFDAVLEPCPRDDRAAARRVFEGFGAGRSAPRSPGHASQPGVPVFSPHDLRHGRISLMHLGCVPWARIGERVGQRDLTVTANTYTHVLADETELDTRSLLLARGFADGLGTWLRDHC